MDQVGLHQHLDKAFERPEETILPSISVMLEKLVETARLGRSGDAELRAAQVRKMALQAEALTKQVQEAAVSASAPQLIRAA